MLFLLLLAAAGWSSKWDEWIDSVADASRIRALGAALVESDAERMKKEEEARFRQELKQRFGFDTVDCDKDGNCLMRAFSHQLYGSAERHAELRARCCDYMEQEREYFATFISEPFDEYVAKRRQDKEWGSKMRSTDAD